MRIRTILSTLAVFVLSACPARAVYSADWTLSQSASFQQQVQMAVFHAALSIVNEAATTHPALDAKRHALAQAVLGTGSAGFGPPNGVLNMQFVWAAIETGLAGTPTDAQVDTAIATVWNGISGVSARDLADLQ